MSELGVLIRAMLYQFDSRAFGTSQAMLQHIFGKGKLPVNVGLHAVIHGGVNLGP